MAAIPADPYHRALYAVAGVGAAVVGTIAVREMFVEGITDEERADMARVLAGGGVSAASAYALGLRWKDLDPETIGGYLLDFRLPPEKTTARLALSAGAGYAAMAVTKWVMKP